LTMPGMTFVERLTLVLCALGLILFAVGCIFALCGYEEGIAVPLVKAGGIAILLGFCAVAVLIARDILTA